MDGENGKGTSYSHREWRSKRLVAGPTAESFVVPVGLVVESSPEALRFRGPASAVALLDEEFAKLERSEPGAEAHVEGWILRVQEEFPVDVPEHVIVMSWDCWGMAGTILSDVAYGYEMYPSDFSQVGYVAIIDDKGQRHPWPRPDIGVIVEGPLLGK